MRFLALLLPLTVASVAGAIPHHAVVRVADLRAVDADLDDDDNDTPPMPVPQNLPVPFAFGYATAQGMSTPVPVAEVSATAVVRDSFSALGDDNTSVPPDTAGAVSRDQALVALNSQLSIQSRNGAVLRTVSTRTLFDAVRGGYRTFDPKVIFDPATNRWYVCVITDQKTRSTTPRNGSAMLLAVSQTADALGAWDLYRYDAPSGVWYDYPSFGLDASRIVVSMNVYNLSDDKFNRAVIYVLDKVHPDQSPGQLDVTSSGGTIVPATSFDSSTTTYMIQRWNGNSRGIGYLRLYTVTHDALTPVGFIQLSSAWAGEGTTNDTDFAPQAGTSTKIDTGDDRLRTAYLRNGSIWTTHTVFLPSTTPTRAAVQWWQISTSGATQQTGRLDDPLGVFFYAYPSLAVNKNNDVLIAGTRFSGTTLPSAFLTWRLGADAPNALSDALVFKDGESSYVKVGTTANRWGDYSSAVVDPANDTDFWTIQEYAAKPNGGTDRWGTWWVHVQVAPAAITPKRRATRH